MKYLPPLALGNPAFRSRGLPWAFAFPRGGNLRGGTLISWPDRAAQRGHHKQRDGEPSPFQTKLTNWRIVFRAFRATPTTEARRKTFSWAPCRVVVALEETKS